MALPEFEGSVSARGEDLILIESKGVNEIAMSGTGEGWIDKLRIQSSAMEIVDIKSISTGNCSKAGLWSDGGCIASLDLVERGPLSRAGKGCG